MKPSPTNKKLYDKIKEEAKRKFNLQWNYKDTKEGSKTTNTLTSWY